MLREKLITETPAKQIWSRIITGDMLANLLEQYVEELNERGSHINFSSAWENVINMMSHSVYEGCVEYLHDETTKKVLKPGELPMTRVDVVQLFDQVRTEIFSRFRDLLRLAYTKEERQNIVLKMEQLEQEIKKRMKPFEQNNKREADKKLKELDTQAIYRIKREIEQDAQSLMKYDLGKDLQAYLDTMQNGMEKLSISDNDCINFILQQLPEHFNHINETLQGTLLQPVEENFEIEEKRKAKSKVTEEVKTLDAERKAEMAQIRELKRQIKYKKKDLELTKKNITITDASITSIQEQIESKQKAKIEQDKMFAESRKEREGKRLIKLNK